MVAAAGFRFCGVAPTLEGFCKCFFITHAFIDECEFVQCRGRKVCDAGCVFVVAYRALDFVRMIAGEFSRANRTLEAAIRRALSEHFDLALVEVQRSAPIFHRLEQFLEGSQRLEVLGVSFECGRVGSTRTRRRVQAAPADVAKPAQQRGAPGPDCRRNVFEFVFEGLGDFCPTPEAFEFPPQCPQSGHAEPVPLQNLSIGRNCGGRQMQSLGPQVTQPEPAFRIVRLALQVRGEPLFEFDPIALNLEELQ